MYKNKKLYKILVDTSTVGLLKLEVAPLRFKKDPIKKNKTQRGGMLAFNKRVMDLRSPSYTYDVT